MVRTRFAPSPTGFMHVGNFRTGLFAWLLARHFNGTFILRLEDTDKKREVDGSEDHIMKCFEVLGLDWDEGIKVGGSFAPYRQSERLDHYRAWGKKLIDTGRAYADSRSHEELNALRKDARDKKRPFIARDYRPKNLPNWQPGMPLRFKSEPKAYKWRDEVMGELQTGPEVVDDFILIKADGFPTYNFAHIIDDHEMEVTHVIRGQEFIASMPNYLNLYEALDLKWPVFAHMPHILNEHGNKKLGKRDGAKDLLDYVYDGFLPEALVNFIASLGWNDGTEQELFKVEELVKKFSLERVQRSGARFDEKRLLWMNGHFIREKTLNELYDLSESFWPESARSSDDDYKKCVLALVQERLKYLAELPELTDFFFKEPATEQVIELFNSPVDKGLKSLEISKYIYFLQAVNDDLSSSDFSEEDIKTRLNNLLEKLNTKPGSLFAAVRVAATGSSASPELFGTLHVLGKEKSLKRLQKAISILEQQP